MYQPPKEPRDKSSPFVDWLVYFLRWAKSERVLQIKGFNVKQTSEGKVFFPPSNLNLVGLQWQTPNRELDPTKSVPKNTLVYVSPDNPIVTTGLTDLVSGSVVKANPGVYCSAKTIPAQVTISGTIKYNVPVNPVPGAPSATGVTSPITGDYDGTNVYWLPVGTSASGGTIVNYDTTGGTAYSGGTIAFVASQFTYSGITVLPGTYALLSSQSTPASPTGNQIPQIPVPTSGTIYWVPIAAGLVAAGTCTSSGGSTVYVNATATF